MFIRRLKSRNGNTQVQVVEKVKRNNRVVKHLGTARNNLELQQLTVLAQQFIDEARIKSGKISLFDTRYTPSDLDRWLSRLLLIGTFDSVTWHFFNYFYRLLGFCQLKDDCFRDLVIARIAHPVSKARTREWLKTKLNRRYSLTALYRGMERTYHLRYQDKLEQQLWNFAIRAFSPAISILFFDVTTLYYEAFDEDDLRKCGFSKDRKDNQPQLIVALTVTVQGFPLQVRVFPGNKFEGHTLLPCLKEIVARRRLKNFIVVADSAMVSVKNMEELAAAKLQFIVGARLGNLPKKLFDRVVGQIPRTDGSSRRFNLIRSRVLVVGYSTKRANKDRTDRNKQLKRANYALHNPAAITRRYKFLEKAGKAGWRLNQAGLKKAVQLEGLKGYSTNARQFTNKEIMGKYAALWQIERSFRISKSDLRARPVFHTVKEKIEAHISIVFAGLAIARYAEIATGKSLQKILELLDGVKEAVLKDPVSGEIFPKYTEVDNPQVISLLKQANINWVT